MQLGGIFVRIDRFPSQFILVHLCFIQPDAIYDSHSCFRILKFGVLGGNLSTFWAAILLETCVKLLVILFSIVHVLLDYSYIIIYFPC